MVFRIILGQHFGQQHTKKQGKFKKPLAFLCIIWYNNVAKILLISAISEHFVRSCLSKFGIALGSGPRGLGFESRHSDQIIKSTLLGNVIKFRRDLRNPCLKGGTAAEQALS